MPTEKSEVVGNAVEDCTVLLNVRQFGSVIRSLHRKNNMFLVVGRYLVPFFFTFIFCRLGFIWYDSDATNSRTADLATLRMIAAGAAWQIDI